jgi:hypothetical protein
MNNSSNSIFERYIQSINEAFMPWSGNRKAGLGKKSLVRHSTQIRLKDEVRQQQIEIAIKYGAIFNVLEGLSEKYYKGNRKKVKQLISDYTGVGNPTVKTIFNPLEYGLPPYNIPLYDIPNRLLAIKARQPQITGYRIKENLQRNLFENFYDLMCNLYRERGGNPDNVNELEMVLSFPTKIHHEFKKWGDEHRDVLRPQLFGGESEADRNNEFVHITNVRELQGKNWDRLSKEEKVGNLLFWGDPRSPESKDTTYKPESAKTPDNLAGATLAAPDRKKLAEKRKRKPANKTKKPATKKPKAEPKNESFIQMIPF